MDLIEHQLSLNQDVVMDAVRDFFLSWARFYLEHSTEQANASALEYLQGYELSR